MFCSFLRNVTTISIVVTPRSSLAKEKNKILFWHNWVANQLKKKFFNVAIKIHTIRMDKK